MAIWSTCSILDSIEKARRNIRDYIDYMLTNQKADLEMDLMDRIRDLHDLLHNKLNHFEEDREDNFQEIFEQLARLTANSNDIREAVKADEKKELIEENQRLRRKFLRLSRFIKNQEDE